MKKQKTKKSPATAEGPQDVPHLDDAITRIASAVARRARKHWKVIAACFVLLCVGIATYHVVEVVAASTEASYYERLYRLTGTPEALDAKNPADTKALEALARDVAGSPAERFVAKRIVTYLLGRVDALESSPGAAESEKAPETSRDAERKELLDAAERIVKSVSARLANDPDIQEWAQYALRKIASERTAEKPWLKHRQRYEIVVPADAASLPKAEEGAAAEGEKGKEPPADAGAPEPAVPSDAPSRAEEEGPAKQAAGTEQATELSESASDTVPPAEGAPAASTSAPERPEASGASPQDTADTPAGGNASDR